MSIELLPVNKLASVICSNIKNPDVVFVFSTDIDMTSWAEWCVQNTALTDVTTVSLDRFMAWDDFKRQFVVASQKGKHAIPSLLRKVFVYNLISQNATKAAEGEPLLKSVINPLYAQDGYSFADWISSNIPSLKMWNDRFEKLKLKNPEAVDAEDEDYEFIYKEYCKFLGEEMFEPSWLTPDFSGSTKKFLIFYPQQFSDYDEYKDILSNLHNVVLYNLKEADVRPVVYKYSDARKELRMSVLYIRNLVENSNGKIKYSDVAFHAPDLNNYLPYVEREFKKYCVPYTVRCGNPYTINCAGSVFENIKDCKDNNFSYNSVRTLLLNEYIPWKEKQVNESLVREGCELHCICNYETGRANDIWIKSLKKTGTCERELKLYEELRKAVESLCDAKTFANLKKAWITFEQDFLSKTEFTVEANNILSSCVRVLDELIELEEDFIDSLNLEIYKPYDFFLNELRTKTYTPQKNVTGVNIFDYKVAACGAYKYNLVINCNQNSITVSKKQLSFLNNQKRSALGINDDDMATPVYICLYSKFNTEQECNTIYSFSENSFSGFAIPHNYFDAQEFPAELEQLLDGQDFIKNEKKWFLTEQKVPSVYSEEQKVQFERWSKTADYSLLSDNTAAVPELEDKLNYILKEVRSKDSDSKDCIKITQSDLKNFFPCPRKWLLNNIFKLREDSLDASLFEIYDQGNINHKVLELLFVSFKEKYGKVPVCINGSFGQLQNEIESLVKDKVQLSIHSYSQNFAGSPLALEVLDSQVNTFSQLILSFLYNFCEPAAAKSFGGLNIVDTEKWLSFKDDNKEYGLGGKIDCILSDDDGNVILVDYKTSSNPKISASAINEVTGALEDFQCAEYVLLYNNHKDSSVKVSKMAFTSIKKYDVAVVVDELTGGKNQYTPEEYEPTLQLFTQYSDCFYDAVKSKQFVPVTDKTKTVFNYVNTYENCAACDFKSICRSSFTVAGHNL